MRATPTVLIVSLLLVAVAAQAQEHHGSVVTSTPQWEKVKTLVGEWQGYVVEDEKKTPVTISIRMTADGSAVMHWMDANGPYEMITMFHMDGSELMATHYCAAHNQPRFRATPSDSTDKIAFAFKDGTNIRPGDGYMRTLELVFTDADHHDELWGSEQGGKVYTATFRMTRKK